MSLALPNTPSGRAAAAQLRKLREARVADSVADSIAGSSKFDLSSDEFLSRRDIKDQLAKLSDYVAAQRERDPDYTLPKPVGWRIQVLILMPPEKSAGGVVLPTDVSEAYAHKAVQGIVIAVGGDAYADPERFPNGAWVKIGDRVQFKRYDASQFEMANGQKLGTMNDSQPIGVMDSGWEVIQ